MGIGDTVHEALQAVGLTPERVERWIGSPCGCEERRQKLNRLGWWAARVLRGSKDRAVEFLEEMLR